MIDNAERNPSPSSGTRVRLYIIHRNRLLRDCLVAIFSKQERFDVVEMNPDDEEYPLRLAKDKADVVLIDVNSGREEALAAIHWIHEHLEKTKVLAIVSSTSEENLADLMTAGVHGCVMEYSPLIELQDAVARVVDGHSFCSPEMLQTLFSQFAKMAHETHWRQQITSVELTRRELEILGMISNHLGNKQIAKKLCISLNTVKNHVHNILDKLQVSSRFEAVEYAKHRKWLTEVCNRWE